MKSISLSQIILNTIATNIPVLEDVRALVVFIDYQCPSTAVAKAGPAHAPAGPSHPILHSSAGAARLFCGFKEICSLVWHHVQRWEPACMPLCIAYGD